MNKFVKAIGLIAVFILPFFAQAQQSTLRAQIIELSKPAKGIVGVSVLGLEDRDTVNVHSTAKLVMHSVIKLPIAMAVLHLVDSGLFTLDKTIKIKKKDLDTLYSPLRDKFPDGGDFTLRDLLSYMVSQSDNDAADAVLNFLGGTDQVDYYLHQVAKINGIDVNASEIDMAKEWGAQYTNWAKTVDMVKMLDKIYNGNLFSPASRDFLIKIMQQTTTGPNRIKGLLPAGTVVAHKTGTSPTNAAGLSPATNDVGVITLPNGKHVAIAIFVCNSTADEATREKVIANIAKAVYDYEVKK
jgi:beta-lactamase class A